MRETVYPIAHCFKQETTLKAPGLWARDIEIAQLLCFAQEYQIAISRVHDVLHFTDLRVLPKHLLRFPFLAAEL